MQLAAEKRVPARFIPKSLPATSSAADEEINAYIAIRDGLLAEAERTPTPPNLKAVAVANDFVATCVRPARAPYGAQHLSERDAVPARIRCELVNRRVAQLRAPIDSAARAA